jgi:(p)ppGpp synthase/HD superfamily hydrolase
VPYVSHLLGVASLVLEAGGSETEAVAALLHDAVEDQDVKPTKIARRYGVRVADIVTRCTDSLVLPGDEPQEPSPGHRQQPRGSGDWRARKEAYLEHLEAETDPSVLLVSAADKLHNARSVVADLRNPPAWSQFNAPPKDQLWYYTSLRETLAGRIPAYLQQELDAAVAEIVSRTELGFETRAWDAAHSK